MQPIHERMPVIPDSSADAIWLDPYASADMLRSLLVPSAADRMQAFPVNPWVNNPEHEGPRWIAPASA